MIRVETHESWQEWVMLTQAEATNTCMSCDGDGHHGFEEETGCLYICYGCGGTGKHYHYGRAA